MYEYKAEIVRVVDGDTLDLDIDLGFGVTKRERIRLARVDAWERRGVERTQGIEATNFVVALAELHDYECLVRTSKEKGKYGRYIAEVYFDTTRVKDEWLNLSDLLVKEGHAEWY